jgi:tetratricopeptide (TPR) repeat protein
MSKKTKQSNPSKPARSVSAPQPTPRVGINHWLVAGLLGAVAFILYLNTFGHGFVLDDPLVITLNQYVQKGFGGWIDIFSHSYRAGSSVSTDSEYMYRPLSVAAFAAEWAIAPNAPGFHHFMNVIWYLATVALLYLTLREILHRYAPLLVAAAVLLFAVHPLHTEVVANIKSRDEIMSLFFGLLCLKWIWAYHEKDAKNKLLPAIIAFFLSLLAKEGAVTLLLIVPLVLYFFGKERSIVQAFQGSLWLWAPFLCWFVIRFVVMQGKMAYTPNFNDNQLVAAGIMDRWATSFVLMGQYLKLLVLPFTMSWDYSYNQIPTVGWSHWKALLSLALHLGLAVLAIRGWQKRQLLSFCILAYVVSMALYSNFFILIGAMLGERLTYTASIWFSLAIAFIVWKMLKTSAPEQPKSLFEGNQTSSFALVIGILALAMGYRTIQRNADWKSNNTLFLADQYNAPDSYRTIRAAGEQLMLKYAENPQTPDSSKLLNQIEQLYQKSLDIRPTENAYIGLGNVAYFRKNYTRSVDMMQKALELTPNNQLAKERMVIAYRDWGKYEGQVKNNLPRAVELLQSALAIDSTDGPSLRFLGTAYGLQNKHQQAISCFEKVLQKEPNDKEIMKNLAIGYQLLGNPEKSAEYARKAQ